MPLSRDPRPVGCTGQGWRGGPWDPGTEPQRRSGAKGAQCRGCWQNVLKREGLGHTVEMLVAGVLYLLPVMWLGILTTIFEI